MDPRLMGASMVPSTVNGGEISRTLMNTSPGSLSSNARLSDAPRRQRLRLPHRRTLSAADRVSTGLDFTGGPTRPSVVVTSAQPTGSQPDLVPARVHLSSGRY